MKKRSAKRWKKKEIPEEQTGDEIVDYLPEKVIKILEKSEHKFSINEQILLTLLAQIIVEIGIKEEL